MLAAGPLDACSVVAGWSAFLDTFDLKVDEITERGRTLGRSAPATYGEFARQPSIPEEASPPEAMQVVRNVVDAHATVIASLAAAEQTNDAATADLDWMSNSPEVLQ